MNAHQKTFDALVERYLSRSWTATDGLSEKDIKRAETRLGHKLPTALRSFYLSVGAVTELCSAHNFILHPKDLNFEDGYLLFMEENQGVVTWGIKKKDLRKADPETWQRNNASEEWYSEDKSFTELLTSMFDWYKQLGVWRQDS